MEVTHLEAGTLGNRRFGLPAGMQAFIPWLPITTPADVIQGANLLRLAGFKPVPHIATRRLKNRGEADSLLGRLVAEAGVETVLLIGGDLPSPAGPFDSSLALLESGLLEKAGIRSVGLAGYPEGHPVLSADTLRQSLADKLHQAKNCGLDAFIVSQFCFDGAAIARWLLTLREHERDIPVKIGVAGPTRLRKLLALGLRCGVGNSLRILKGKSGMMSAMLSAEGPDEVIANFESMSNGEATGSVSLHVFAFGGVEVAARWIDGAAASRWTGTHDGVRATIGR